MIRENADVTIVWSQLDNANVDTLFDENVGSLNMTRSEFQLIYHTVASGYRALAISKGAQKSNEATEHLFATEASSKEIS